MKKWACFSLAAIMLFGLLTGISSAAAAFATVILDGKKVAFPDAQPYVNEDGRTMVPVRFVAEGLGADVKWLDETSTVVIRMEKQEIRLTVGENKAVVGGVENTFDTKAIISGERTFVPLRFISEILGAEVKWDAGTMAVYVTSAEDKTAKYDPWGRLIRTTDLPKNANDFPYILADLPNDMYEMPYPYSYPTKSKVSAVLYSTIPEFNKRNVDIWISRLKTFGALWLNVDYKTIDDTWAQEVFNTKMQNSNAELKYIRRYVDWVKENEIQIEGYLDPEPSMIYRNGFGDNFVRSKFRIKFISYKENKDFLYDERFPNGTTFEKNVWYEGYADISMSTNVGGDWGPTLKVSPSASLFYNHSIQKME